MGLVSLIVESFSQLRDVVITTPSNGDTIAYNSSTGKWINGSAPTILGVPVLYGPYIVNYTDIPHDLNYKNLWTPAVGDVLLSLFADHKTVIQWDTGRLYIGPGVTAPSPPTNSLTDSADGNITLGGGASLDFLQEAYNQEQFDGTGTPYGSSGYVFTTTTPVRIFLSLSLQADPTRGHVELYALIARPIAP